MQELMKISLGGLTAYLVNRAYMRSVRHFVPKNRYVNINLLGNPVRLDRQDLEQVYLETDCVREPENIFLYRALANSGLCTTFVDVGANYGHVASKIYKHYKRVVLIDANPNATAFLGTMFAGQNHVEVKNCALVDDPMLNSVTLLVPETSSGLAHLSTSTGAFHMPGEKAFECSATTLDNLLADQAVESAYVKIDVEGLESSVIRGGQTSVHRKNVIVGFEALSREFAAECCALFTDHSFYFGRFDFLNPTGALTKSIPGIFRSVIGGGNIAIYKFKDIKDVQLDNFSQIVAVPSALVENFESALRFEHAKLSGRIELQKM